MVNLLEQFLAAEAACAAACDAAGVVTREAKTAYAASLQRNGPESFTQPSSAWHALQYALNAEAELAPAFNAAHTARVDYERRLAQAMAAGVD